MNKKRETLTITFRDKEDKTTFLNNVESLSNSKELGFENIRDKVDVLTRPTIDNVMRSHYDRFGRYCPTDIEVVDWLHSNMTIYFNFFSCDMRDVSTITVIDIANNTNCLDGYEVTIRGGFGIRAVDIIPSIVYKDILMYVARNMSNLEKMALVEGHFTNIEIDTRLFRFDDDGSILNFIKPKRLVTDISNFDITWRLCGEKY